MAGTPYATVLSTVGNRPLQFGTYSTLALTLDTSQNATFAGNVTVTGNISAANLTTSGTFAASGPTSFTNTGTTTFAGPISSTSGNLTVSSSGTSNSLILNPNGGNIGIGTTSPQGPLDISGQVNPYLRFTSTATGSPYGFLQYDQSEGNFMRIYDGSQYSMVWRAGNVGIGTATPSATLEVSSGNNTGLNDAIWLSGGASAYESGPRLVFHETFGSNPYPTWRLAEVGSVYQSGTNTYGGALIFNTNSGASVTDISEKMRISYNGNVGIGTASPGRKLDVNGDVNIGTNLLVGSGIYSGHIYTLGSGLGIQNGTSATIMLFTETGNVGIGTVSPGAKLDVAGGANIQGNLTASGNITAANVTATGTFSASGTTSFTNTGVTTFAGPISSASGNLTVSSSGTSNNLLLNPNGGNVGIGTNSPQGTLHLQSTADYDPQELLENISNTGAGYLIFQKARAGQAAIASGDGLGTVMFEGYSNGGYQKSSYLTAVADTAPSGSNVFSAVTIKTLNTSGILAERFRISSNGNVGIGTTNPSYLLSVSGTIQAKEVIVQTGWSDYVFDPNYRLAPLAEVKRQIQEERHLPGMPSAQEVAEHGVKTGEMEAKLLAKIEELTLHVINQEERMTRQDAYINQQAKRIDCLEDENAALRTYR